ncbi:MAG: hypothetical protein O3A46_06810 [Candidatus Poribacteria bacterium]|nr:hypothetical protein [Candidatus Poribacteria bacterium]
MPEGWAVRFPNLTVDEFTEESPATRRYNCIAFAAGIEDAWYDSELGWFDDTPQGRTIGHLIDGFESVGYVVCEDGQLEDDHEKIALYANDDGEWEHTQRVN